MGGGEQGGQGGEAVLQLLQGVPEALLDGDIRSGRIRQRPGQVGFQALDRLLHPGLVAARMEAGR